jgi:hypothetical protein
MNPASVPTAMGFEQEGNGNEEGPATASLLLLPSVKTPGGEL